MDSSQHACKPTVYIPLVLIKKSALARDHREHVLADVLGDLEAVLRRDLGLPHLLEAGREVSRRRYPVLRAVLADQRDHGLPALR